MQNIIDHFRWDISQAAPFTGNTDVDDALCTIEPWDTTTNGVLNALDDLKYDCTDEQIEEWAAHPAIPDFLNTVNRIWNDLLASHSLHWTI